MSRAQRRDRSFSPDDLRLVVIEVGGTRYAVDIMRIRQVLRPLSIVALPKAPPFVEGVIELRGVILPVIDLRRRFDLPSRQSQAGVRFLVVTLVLGGQRMVVALIVDRVIEPIRLPKTAFKPRPATLGGNLLLGVIHDAGQLYMLLDLDQILSSTEKLDLHSLQPVATGSITREKGE